MNSIFIFIFLSMIALTGLSKKDREISKTHYTTLFCRDYSMSSFKERTKDLKVNLVFHEEILNKISLPKRTTDNN